MKSIGWKFVLCAGAFALAFALVVIVHTWSVSRQSMTEATEDSLELGLQFDLAIREYVSDDVRPVVQRCVGDDEFIPSAMSSTYVARSIFEKVRREHPDFVIKFSSDRPHNPINLAGPEELAILEYFRQTPEAKQWVGKAFLGGRECLVHAIPRRMERSCLRCHGDPEDAPASLIAAYGAGQGFHWQIGDVIAMDLVGVPMARIESALSSQATTQIAFLVLCLLGLVGVLVVVFRRLVTRRLAVLQRHFCRVAEDPSCLDVTPLKVSGCDEIAGLARSFNALVSRIRLYQTSLESMVAQRTRKLVAEVAERKRTELELRLNEARLEAVLKLNQMTEASPQEITAFALEEGVRLTQSKIGYLAFLNEDETELTMHSWSAEAMRECTIIEKPLKYQVSQTGLWGEAIRQRRPVITNEYSASSPLKKGCPAGHVPIARHMNVPILSDERIVAVAGVGNKEESYDDADVRQLTLLMQGMWGLLERRRAEEQLRAAMENAKAADRAKSLFLANMSHEIRTPMTAILGYADLLLGPEGPEELVEDHRQALETVRRNGEHLLHLINDILDLSKVEAGRLQVDCQTCRTAEILEEVVRLTQIRAQEKRLPLWVDYLGGVPESISTDPVRLRQILVNLVTNAIKFTDSGEVRIRVRLAESAEGKPMLELAVRDTGIGLTETEIGRLFQPFNQIDHGINRMHGGTGLGLAISLRLARALGGNIAVQSTPGKGSTFTVSIDPGNLAGVQLLDRLEQTSSDHSIDQPPSFDESRLDGRVLLAEDGPDNQRLISHLLRKAGAEVTIVDNGQRAVDEALSAAAAETSFDIVLMDMQMPVMDGYAATQLLRRNGYRGLVVALTAHAMADDRQRCLDAGCDWYMSKPVTRQALLATLGWLKRQRASAVQ